MKKTIYNKLKLGTPYTNSGTYYMDTADAATLILKELNSVFPKVKFQKTTRRYAGGSSIDISLADSFDFMNQICDSNTNPGITNSGGYYWIARALGVQGVQAKLGVGHIRQRRSEVVNVLKCAFDGVVRHGFVKVAFLG